MKRKISTNFKKRKRKISNKKMDNYLISFESIEKYLIKNDFRIPVWRDIYIEAYNKYSEYNLKHSFWISEAKVHELLGYIAEKIHSLEWFNKSNPELLKDPSEIKTLKELADFRLKNGIALPIDLYYSKEFCGGPVMASTSGISPTIWINTNSTYFEGSRGYNANGPILIADENIKKQVENGTAKIVFIDMDGVIFSKTENKDKITKLDFSENELRTIWTTPRFSVGLFDCISGYRTEAYKKLLKWQEEDSSIYFVLCTAHMAIKDVIAFRDILLKPLRIIGEVRPRNFEGILKWLETFVAGNEAKFVCLDDDAWYFRNPKNTGFLNNEDYTCVSLELIKPRLLIQDSNIENAKTILQTKRTTSYKEYINKPELWKYIKCI